MLPVSTRLALTVLVTLALGLGTVACGAEDDADSAPSTGNPVQLCRDQWGDIASNLEGLDEDEHPSALRKRWANVLATVSIYQQTETAEACQENIETLSTGITQLRQFSTRLQPYDMEYQSEQVADAVARYVAAPLPEPVRKKGKLVKPPTKLAVTAALATLRTQAAAANADLAPPWGQLDAVELTDAAAVDSALQDLVFYARDSSSWVACNQALAVIRAAIAASPAASSTPSAAPSSTPSATPSSTPTP